MTEPFRFTISKAETITESLTYRRVARDEVEELIALLKACGCDVRMTWPANRATAQVEIYSVPSPEEINRRINRGGGRRKLYMFVHDPIDGLPIDATAGQFIEWYKTHTAEEGQKALGLKPATFSRRLKDIKAAAANKPDTPLSNL